MDHNERRCGDCQLCCKLLPMKAGSDLKLRAETLAKLVELGMLDAETRVMHDFNKPAGEHCPHQRHGKGCVSLQSTTVRLPILELPLARQR